MTAFKFLVRMILLLSLVSISSYAVTLETNTFEVNLEGWTGSGITRTGAGNKVMNIPNQATASKSYSYPAYANQGVSLTLTAAKYNYESSDTILITFNGKTVYNSNTVGTITLNGWLDNNGELNVTIKSNSDDGAEYLTVDNVTLNTGLVYTADNPRDYSIIYQTNRYGDMKIIGNSILCEDDGTGQCKATVDTTKNNNDLNTLFYKLPSDSADANITNSTSYTFALPAGVSKSDVLWAGLYWQAGIKGTPTATQIANAQKVKLKAPGDSAYRDITAETVNGTHTNRFNWMINTTINTAWYYQGVKEITGIVQSAGAGTYQVANIEATSGTAYTPGHFGGWAIALVYKDANATLKNITVYDGFNAINSSHTVTTTLSGFLTPSSGTVDSKFMIFGSEGDLNYNKDRISITNNTGTAYYLKADGTASTTSGDYNPMNSSITMIAGDTRSPDYTNAIGIDIDTYNVGTSAGGLGIIGNGQTSTTITMSTGDDVYNPGLFAFSTQIYAPVINITKTPSTSGVLSGGQQINYTAAFTNAGKEVAKEITIYDDFTQNLLYRTDGNVTSPAVYLSDMIDLNATKLKQSIRLSDANSTTVWHCPTGVSSAECTYSDANCSVDYTGDPSTTATKMWCYLPTVALNTTYTMTFSVNLKAYPDTKSQSVVVANTMFADYKDNLTGQSMPTSASNIADAGQYLYVPVIPGYADIIDTFTSIANYNTGADQYIKTKIASHQNTTITAVHLNLSNLAEAYTAPDSGWKYSVIPFWSDGTCTTQENVYDTSGVQIVLDIPVGYAAMAGNIRVKDKALKNGRFKIVRVDPATLNTAGQTCIENSSLTGNFARVAQCANSEIQYKAAFGDTAWNRCGMGGGKPCESSNHGAADPTDPTYNPLYGGELGCYICTFDINPTCSTDNFAIRPDRMEIISTHYDYPNLFRAAQDYNTTIHAYNALNTDTLDYNVTAANGVFDVNNSIKYNRNDVITPSMLGTVAFAGSDFNMSDGVSVKAGVVGNEVADLTFDDVGKIDLHVEDRVWAAVDINNPVDMTPHDCSATGAYVCGDRNVTFIPHHFDFNTLTLTNNNGNPGSFTYLANEVGQMAGRIETQMRALNKNGNVTQNFDANPLWENNIIVTPTVTRPTYIYPDANETMIANIAVGFGTGADANGTKTIVWNDNNTSTYLRYNFRRDVNLTVNPFDVNGSDLNISMVSNYTDVSNGHTAAITGERNATAAGITTFVYGRVNPLSTTVFGTEDWIKAQSYMEVFGTGQVTLGVPLSPSRTGGNWWINSVHAVTDGDANVTVLEIGNTPTTDPALMPTNTGPTLGVTTYSWAPNIFTPPTEFTAHIQTMPWLWYGANALPYIDPSLGNLNCLTHPCFNVKVRPTITNWVGGGDFKGNKSQQNTATDETLGEDMLVPRIRK